MDTIGKYKLVRVIGEGGMGRVYEAMDPVIGRRVAVKTISLNVVADAETRARFFREAQAAGQLSHPNLITIHDIGESENTPYIVMEYLEGMDLSHAIQKERLSYDRKMQIMVDVCEGLAFAHVHDIVHRDIKPANIFLTNQGRVKILDFGLARGSLSDVTRTGKLVGTPNYMAPEQIRGDDIDHRADIFSTGVVFYELLSGRKAFEGDSIATTMYKVLETQPQPVHLIDEQLPASLSEIIDRSLAKDRSARFQTSTRDARRDRGGAWAAASDRAVAFANRAAAGAGQVSQAGHKRGAEQPIETDDLDRREPGARGPRRIHDLEPAVACSRTGSASRAHRACSSSARSGRERGRRPPRRRHHRLLRFRHRPWRRRLDRTRLTAPQRRRPGSPAPQRSQRPRSRRLPPQRLLHQRRRSNPNPPPRRRR